VTVERHATDSSLLDSYRGLADLFRELLSAQTITSLLERIADTAARLVHYDSLTIYEADSGKRLLVPVLARDRWADEILRNRIPFGEGLTGNAVVLGEPVLVNHAHRDNRGRVVPGTPDDEPEALISVPLLARGAVLGALNLYRLGPDALFTERDLELAMRFGDLAALALENGQTRAALEHRAERDSLTGLYNHGHFYDRLAAELARAERTDEVVTVMMLDLDDFKQVNNLFGHRAADELLIAFSSLLQASIRTADVACRIGGDEFGMIMPASTRAEAEHLAARLRTQLSSVETLTGAMATVSIGICEARPLRLAPHELPVAVDALVRSAGSAMRAAKQQGKDRASAC
jgi:diguanylate cyclase (GGDEF)-like protein